MKQNNIIAGKVKPAQPDYYNHAGYLMVFGFMDQFFNNTVYHFEDGLKGNSGNRSNILGNKEADGLAQMASMLSILKLGAQVKARKFPLTKRLRF